MGPTVVGSSKMVRKSLMLEARKVKLLVQRLGARSESEAIRLVIDGILFEDEVMKQVAKLRRRGTLADAYRRASC
jgi:hypothetical protein